MKLSANRFALAEHQRNIWRVALDEGVDIKETLESSFWTHVASKLRAGDLIELLPEDGAWFATLIVRDADRIWAKVEVLSQTKFGATTAAPESVAAGYDVQWKGPVRKFVVVRVADKQPMSEQHGTREAASAWLVAHTRQAAA